MDQLYENYEIRQFGFLSAKTSIEASSKKYDPSFSRTFAVQNF